MGVVLSFPPHPPPLPLVNQSKYLGIIISENNCVPDLKRQMCKLYANVNMIIRKFSRCSPDVKCFLFKSYCPNLYCSILWYDCSKTAFKTLRIAYNNSLRKLLGIPKYNSASEMFVCLNIPSFDELLRKYVYSFRNRLVCSQNCIFLLVSVAQLCRYILLYGFGGCPFLHYNVHVRIYIHFKSFLLSKRLKFRNCICSVAVLCMKTGVSRNFDIIFNFVLKMIGHSPSMGQCILTRNIKKVEQL